jgi:S-adenosylmethionine hydrolase
MPIITLTTDWKQNDFYTGALKGTILTKCPDIQIVDISHQIPPFNTSQAAFVIKNSYNHFPKGTIHIIAVDAIPDKGNNYIAIKLNRHFFIGCDNGIFSLIAKDKPEIYIDSYKNAITNITNELFDRVGKNQPFEIFIQSRKYKITHINKTYSETSIGGLLALFNSLGLLEIAMNKANLTDLLNLSIGSTVRIDFLDKKKK